MTACASSSPCRAASIRRWPRPCWPSRVTTSSACRCSSTIRASDGRTPARVRAPAAPSTTCTTRGAWRAAIGIPHYIVNFESQFDEHVVVELRARVRGGPHADSLLALQQRPEVRRRCSTGRAGFGAEQLATGHYARVERDGDGGGSTCSAAPTRRRTRPYFLFSLTQAQLSRAAFPVGHLDKDAVRAHAQRLQLARGRQARQPGDLLRARRRLRRVRRAAGARGRRARARSSTPTAACSARTAACTASRSASARAWACRSREPLYVAGDQARRPRRWWSAPREALGRVTT